MTEAPEETGRAAPAAPAASAPAARQPRDRPQAPHEAQPTSESVAAVPGRCDNHAGDRDSSGGGEAGSEPPSTTSRKASGKVKPASDASAEQASKPQWSETEVREAMRMQPERPRVVRLSRKALIGLGSAASLALSGILFWAFAKPQRAGPPPELINTDTRQTSEALNALPRDYAGIPRLGPPLPGDLGRPMVAAGVTPGRSAANPPAPTPPLPPDPSVQAREQARLRLIQEREAARSARLFASEAQAPQPAAQMVAPSPPSPVTETTAPMDTHGTLLAQASDRQIVASGRLVAPANPYVLQAGAVIPAAMITGLRSDLPGQITAQVTENIYDSVTGRTLLIPQGARLIGDYDAQTRFGQKRALLAWTRLILPDGRSMLLDHQPAADVEGAAGLTDRVNNHWGQIFKAALVTTLLGIGSEMGTSTEESALIRALRRGGSDAASQVGQQLVGRSLDIQPTISVRPGYLVRVIVTRDLTLEPWKG